MCVFTVLTLDRKGHRTVKNTYEDFTILGFPGNRPRVSQDSGESLEINGIYEVSRGF